MEEFNALIGMLSGIPPIKEGIYRGQSPPLPGLTCNTRGSSKQQYNNRHTADSILLPYTAKHNNIYFCANVSRVTSKSNTFDRSPTRMWRGDWLVLGYTDFGMVYTVPLREEGKQVTGILWSTGLRDWETM